MNDTEWSGSGLYSQTLSRHLIVVKRDWNDFSTSNGQYGGWAFYVNMSGIELPVLRSTDLLRDRQDNSADSYDEEYLTEFSIKVKQEQQHGIITGVTG